MPSAHWEGHGVSTLYSILPQIQTLLKYLLPGEVFTSPPSWLTRVRSFASGLLALYCIVYVLFYFLR